MANPQPLTSHAAFEFGEFRFDPRNARLARRGTALPAEPKALKVLEVLIEHSGSLVERDVLLDRVWGRVIVTPGTLTRLIAELRRLLGDDSLKPRFIETVHTKGYRWNAPVTCIGFSARSSAPPGRSIELIGRDEDLVQLERLAAHSRLLTLAGPGGIGKTQLALEFARRRERAQPQSVIWIDLTEAGDEQALPRLIVTGLDLQLSPGLSFAAGTAEAIGERELLLLLDNCEHLVGSLAALARAVLSRCPRASIVCTSQITLDLAEETVYWVSPLALPSYTWQTDTDPMGALLESGAVRLLNDRALAVAPHFQLNDDNAPFVAEICRRLDGLPLALELAAARLTALSPRQLLAALEDRFTVLARQTVTAHPRHGSLRRAIEWSYGLLADGERDLLDRFGVFTGSWSLEAAQAIAGGATAGGETLNRLQSLVQKSLVIVERIPNELRYHLLDTVRAFACMRLEATGNASQVRFLHARYFAQLAVDAEAELLEDDQVAWMDRLDLEWSNLRAAWVWLQSESEYRQLAAALMAGLRWHFWIRGNYSEALQWHREAEAWMAERSAAEQARLFNGYAIALLHAAEFQAALRFATRAESCAVEADLAWEQAYAVGLQSWLASVAVDHAQVERCNTRAATLCERVDRPWMSGFCRLGAAFIPVYAVCGAQALQAMDELSQLFAVDSDRHMQMFVAVQLGLQQFLSEDLPATRRSIARALDLSLCIGNRRGLTAVCETAAYLAASAGEAELAARLLGAADAGRSSSGAPLFPQWEKPHETAWAAVCAQLGTVVAQQLFTAAQLAGLREGAALAAPYLRR